MAAELGERAAVPLADHDVRLGIGTRLVQFVAVRLDLAGKARGEVEHRTAPERPLFESPQVEARHDAEVVAAAAEGAPEIGVLVGVGVDDGAVGEDDLVVEDVVADEAFARGEKG